MTIKDVLIIHFMPGDDSAEIQLTTAEVLDLLAKHINVYPGEITEVADTLVELGFKTIYKDKQLVWLIESK